MIRRADKSNLAWLASSWLVCLASWLVAGGCTRSQYRHAADREAYCLVDSRQSDPRWEVPSRPVEPASISRMYVDPNPDCPPKPQDDLAAKRYMDHPNCIDNTKYYSRFPTKPHTENPIWLDYLPRDEDDNVQLDLELAMDLALLHSREYQSQFELVYLTALDLSDNRFEFACQWAGGLGAGFLAEGEDLGGDRALTVSDGLGFQRQLAGGGQFATSLANSLFWDFGNSGLDAGSASLVSTFTQPLLRGAFRYVRLENLTQAERDMLYTVRDFARFRRLFYLGITDSYLNLLTQVQAIRNTRTNVKNLRASLDEYQAYIDLGMVSPVEVDQVYQNYQSGRLSLLSAEQRLAQSLDNFKFQLGLPPWVPLEIDESLLEPFELVNSELVQLQDAAQQLYQRLVQFLPPEKAPREVLEAGLSDFLELREQVAEQLPAIEDELSAWRERLDALDEDQLSTDDRLDAQQQATAAARITTSLKELHARLEKRDEDAQILRQVLAQYDASPAAAPADDDVASEDDAAEQQQAAPRRRRSVDGDEDAESHPAIVAWQALLDSVGGQLREEVSELYVAQTQIRLFSIDIPSLDIQQQTAITYAHQNRLDLMNTRASVTDAFRRVEVAADQLESSLNLTGRMALGSDPGINNAFRFDSSANSYQVGVQFDGPLNRLNERNAYRASQIRYQQASRALIGQKDLVANEVRSVLRQLQLRRLNFQIARQQLVAATSQVDQAQIDLRTSKSADSNLTLFLLQALQQLLQAKNNLISEWVAYRVEKIRLFTVLELLYLDEQGRWLNEGNGLDDLAQQVVLDTEYFPPALFGNGDSRLADSLGMPSISSDDDSSDVPSPNPSGDDSSTDQPNLENLPLPPAEEGLDAATGPDSAAGAVRIAPGVNLPQETTRPPLGKAIAGSPPASQQGTGNPEADDAIGPEPRSEVKLIPSVPITFGFEPSEQGLQ